ncbi:MAG TPA: SpvB/TcaC N-terminal domain-containing protein, partial [Gemmatimonadaceae bacterium]|nr:SpvB/TcaC N-terminal domain-containing protein [Gemmatimonadaceae bacterium]
MSVPIPTSPSRGGSGPSLALSYDSGSGNGPFGFGWSLGMPGITRRTDRGLPRYLDAEDSDVYVLSESDDLVPMLDDDGDRVVDHASIAGYTVERYRPRIEGAFARIERWTRQSDGDVHWRTLSANNALSIYGATRESRIADPADPARVFSWLLCETRDDRGNAMVVEYKAEDATGVDVTSPEEAGRGDAASAARTANRYLKRVRYGNRVPLLDAQGRRPVHLSPAQRAAADWMFEVVLDYGEHDADAPTPTDGGAWLCRNDPFSVYRSGFEVRTYRLCQR